MNQTTTTKLLTIVFAVFCIGFGIDKFVEFLPICSLTEYISSEGMFFTGVLEIILGIVILLDKFVLLALRIATALIIGGLLLHLLKGTYDIGGALLGAILGLILIFTYKKQSA